jgi:hypothetical protein
VAVVHQWELIVERSSIQRSGQRIASNSGARETVPDGERTLVLAGLNQLTPSHTALYPARMDIGEILSELSQEHAQVTEAILSVERLAAGRGKRRGRPPGWMVAARADEETPKRRGRPPGSKNRAKQEA